MNSLTKQKQTHRHRENKFMGTKGDTLWGGINQELGINIHTLPYIRQITNKDLLYSTGNSTQYSAIPEWEKNLKKNKYMYK